MSNFVCEHCGKEIIEDKDGNYITGCKHYLIEKIIKERIIKERIIKTTGDIRRV